MSGRKSPQLDEVSEEVLKTLPAEIADAFRRYAAGRIWWKWRNYHIDEVSALDEGYYSAIILDERGRTSEIVYIPSRKHWRQRFDHEGGRDALAVFHKGEKQEAAFPLKGVFVNADSLLTNPELQRGMLFFEIRSVGRTVGGQVTIEVQVVKSKAKEPSRIYWYVGVDPEDVLLMVAEPEMVREKLEGEEGKR